MAGYQGEIAQAEAEFNQQRILERIWRKDFSVWSTDPVEITNRLGWLDSPGVSAALADEIIDFVSSLKADGYRNALLLGMGGSSLAGEVFSRSFDSQPGYLNLQVLDSTHPEAVLQQARNLDPRKTLYIVSTKSGSTVETISFMKFFFNQTLAQVGRKQAGRHFIAITDPGSGLESVAKEFNFRRIFLNDPDIGGRYSALSLFGIIPAAMLGIDIKKILHRADMMGRSCQALPGTTPNKNTTVRLGVIMGQLANSGRNKITFITSERLSPFADWLEQLIAESTGKMGKGILPVVDDTIMSPGQYAGDRLFVHLHGQDDHEQEHAVQELREAGHPVIEILCRDVFDIGGEFFRWEMATAIACWRLGVQPFNQPDVESAKVLARDMLAEYRRQGKLPQPAAQFEFPGIRVYAEKHADDFKELMNGWLGSNARDFERTGHEYISIQAYVQPDEKTWHVLQDIKVFLQQKFQTSVTVGYGPRFLHSTGQLHKGDAGKGFFIQILSALGVDAPIPDQAGFNHSSVSFATLITAQAFGDRRALLEKNRRVLTFQLHGDEQAGWVILSRLLAGQG